MEGKEGMEGEEGEERLEVEGINRGEDSGEKVTSPEMCLRGLEKTDVRPGLLPLLGEDGSDGFLPSWFRSSRSSAMSFSIVKSLSCSLKGLRYEKMNSSIDHRE